MAHLSWLVFLYIPCWCRMLVSGKCRYFFFLTSWGSVLQPLQYISPRCTLFILPENWGVQYWVFSMYGFCFAYGKLYSLTVGLSDWAGVLNTKNSLWSIRGGSVMRQGKGLPDDRIFSGSRREWRVNLKICTSSARGYYCIVPCSTLYDKPLFSACCNVPDNVANVTDTGDA